jgi:hypothetical protein
MALNYYILPDNKGPLIRVEIFLRKYYFLSSGWRTPAAMRKKEKREFRSRVRKLNNLLRRIK